MGAPVSVLEGTVSSYPSELGLSTTRASGRSLAAMQEFIEVQRALSRSEDAAEGVRSFVERRPARFTGR